jgi:hypothetical protein
MKTVIQRSIVGVAVALNLFVPTLASAACTLADLKGRWRVYATDYRNWVACPATLDEQGRLVNDTRCRSTSPAPEPMLEVGVMRLRQAPACLFSGVLRIGGEPHSVRSLTLSLDKTTASGIGKYVHGRFSIKLVKVGN